MARMMRVAAAALAWAAGCGDGGAVRADAGAGPGPAQLCEFGAGEPGARAAYLTRGADGATAAYVVDVAAPERACAVYAGGERVEVVGFAADGEALVVFEPGALRWFDLRGGEVGRPAVIAAGRDAELSQNRTWILFSRYAPQADRINEYVAELRPEGVGEPLFVDKLELTEWWAPGLDVLAVWGVPERELHWMVLGGEKGVALRRVLSTTDHDVEAVGWAPGGTRLAALLRRDNLPTRLRWWAIGPQGPGEAGELPVPAGGSAGAPVWSPDGARVAYPVGDGDGLERTVVVEVATGTALSVARMGQLAWSGPEVLVIADDAGLWVADVADGGEPVLAVDAAASAMPARVSPDGLGVAYAGADGANLYRALTAPPGPPVELGLEGYGDARWTPDSAALLLWRAGDPGALALAAPGGSPARQLATDVALPAAGALVRWRPDASAAVVVDAAGTDAQLVDRAVAAPAATALGLPVPAGQRVVDWMWAPLPPDGDED